MARLNTRNRFTETTHEGAPAKRINAEQALRRSVMSCLLWEKEFYEDGEEIAKRILRLAGEVDPVTLAQVAAEARHKMHLRHAPLLLLTALCKHGSGTDLVSRTIAHVVARADELGELLSIYQSINGKDAPLSKQLKLGLGKALAKFDEYQLAKYNRDADVKLRDVMFLVHPKPVGRKQTSLWKRLAADELKTPDTWEVGLSAGKDKTKTFTRLLKEGKLGYLALLRNLRNMVDAGVDAELIKSAILAREGAQRVLPFRYVAAARACPQMEPTLDEALSEAIAGMPPFDGKTVVLVDVSHSMSAPLSARSDMTRMDAAATLASIIHGNLRVFSFSNDLVEVPARRGMAGVDAIKRSQPHANTYLGRAVDHINRTVKHDRLIVVTDEQSHDPVPGPKAERAYMINVASTKNGVGYGAWTHIDGWSENVLRYIQAHEAD